MFDTVGVCSSSRTCLFLFTYGRMMFFRDRFIVSYLSSVSLQGWRKIDLLITAKCWICINKLLWKKSRRRATQKAALLCLSSTLIILTVFAPCWLTVQEEDSKIFITDCYQFITSSGGTSSIVTVVTTSSKNDFFSFSKLVTVCWLSDVVASHWTNFINLSRE